MLDPPELVTVSERDCLLPTVTLPKLSLAALGASCPFARPVPVSESVVELLEALLVIEAVALKAPAALGLKTRLTDVLWPGRIATGRVGALKEKYWLEIVTLLTVTEAMPVFDAVIVSVLLVPAATVPKSTLAWLRVNVPVCGCVLADLLALNPWQPIRKVSPARRNAAAITFPKCLEQTYVGGVFRIVSRGTCPWFYDCLCARGKVHRKSGGPGEIATDIRGTA